MKKIAFLLSFALLLGACSDKTDSVDPGAAPTMPPSSSMAPNFDDFSTSSSSGGRELTIQNWTYAAVSVGAYSAVLYGSLVVPVTAFKMAIDQTPTYDKENKVWVWQYAISLPQNGDYSVKLTAAVDGSNVAWTGYISKTGGFSNFVWFTGTSDTSAKAGSWTLYESPDTPSAWLSAEWTKSDVDGVANVTFTVEKDGANKGSSISYSVDSSSSLDRNVTIADVKTSNNIDVLWSSSDKSGKIKSQVFFSDDVYHCWDTTLNDITCP